VGSAHRTQFGDLLRRYRIEANLTQQALAVRAHLSVQAIGMLERGTRRSPRRDTVVRLSRALGLGPPQAEALLTSGSGDGQVDDVPPVARRTLPRDVATFTGRRRELDELLAAVDRDSRSARAFAITAIDGMAGVGKTAFAIHAAHRLASEYPDGQIFLDLRAHAAGLRPVEPFDALGTLLLTVGVAAPAVPNDLDARVALWRDHLSARRMLIVLDDAAGNEQVRPLLPGGPGCLVLVTSRRRLSALEDVRPLTLDTLPRADAAELFTRLAGGPGQAVESSSVSVLAELSGRLPLAIGLLAGRLRSHPAWTARHLAATLRVTQDRLAEMHAENVAVESAFELSYRDLAPDLKRLFRRLGAHPGRDVERYAAAALDGIEPAEAARRLDALYDDHLLDEPAPGRYRMHDLIRAYARSLADREDADAGAGAVDRLLDHYLGALGTANRHIARRSSPFAASGGEGVERLPDLSTWHGALAWLEAERANLVACFDDAVARGRHRRVIDLARELHPLLDLWGPWDQAMAVQRAALEAARRAGDRLAEADALHDLGDIQRRTGAYQAAVASLEAALASACQLGSRLREASVLNDLGDVQRMLGDCRAAAASLCRALTLHRELDSRLGMAAALNRLGIVRSLTGEHDAAIESLTEALALSRESGYRLVEVNALNNLGCVQLRNDDFAAATESLTASMELARELGIRLYHANAVVNLARVQRMKGDAAAATASLTEALALYRDMGNRSGEGSVLHELGTLQHRGGEYAAATGSITASLAIFRAIGSREGQANALHDLGIVQRLTGDAAAAIVSLTEALTLARELGDALSKAQILNELGTVRLESGDVAGALAHHREALRLARDASSPLEQARAREGIGRCLLRSGDPAGAATDLREALAVYRRLGLPDAERLEKSLPPGGGGGSATTRPGGRGRNPSRRDDPASL
jgi:tetratricopeptide (TPR) repeat protein/transcriptional regulator with XRE-family HTH domain